MKTICLSALLLLPLAVTAQQGMSQAEMQRMRVQAQKMQACMKGVDQQALQRLGKKAEEIDRQVTQLCKAGRRSEAQALALKLGREMLADPNVQKMQECSRLMPAGMGSPFQMPSLAEMEQHQVCDER